MRDPKRIKRILNHIEELWKKHPDQRFGQLLINLGVVADTYTTWSLEDDIIEKKLVAQKEARG